MFSSQLLNLNQNYNNFNYTLLIIYKSIQKFKILKD